MEENQQIHDQEIQHDEEDPQRLVSSVEEITGQNIGVFNMNQASNGIQNQIGNVTQLTNANSNRVNELNNQTQIRTQIVQTQINNGNINQINIQRQQQIQGYTQNINQNQNIVRNAQQFDQNLQTGSSINYEQNAKNIDPMMYSFGGKSAASAQYLASSGNKNLMGINQRENIDNSDFLVSSLTNQNTSDMGLKQSQFTFGQNSYITTDNGINIVFNNNDRVAGNNGGQINQNEIQYTKVQTIGKQKGKLGPSQIVRMKREPRDGESKKRQKEEEANKEEVNDFPLEPRDSRKIN
jgi:hypothetical protein